MRAFQGLVWGCALAVLAADSGSAQAAWNNVFQVCCSSCGKVPAPQAVVSGYADPGCCPQPQTSCTTRYVQRCYYQPVVSYKTSTYVEPVTTYRTSYYYEPCTSYRYSCAYDPCTCSYQQIAQPVTSYRLRSRCCPVTSYLQRTCMTPVTSYQQAFYYEPVTTCCTTTTGAPVAGLPPGASAAPPPAAAPAPYPAGAGAAAPYPAPAAGTEPPPSPAVPPVTEESRTPGSTESRKYYGLPRTPTMPPATDSSFRGSPSRSLPPASPPPKARPDRIASLSRSNVEGQVVDAGRAPRRGARVLLVSADRSGDRQTLTADSAGQFRTNLSPGGWLVYLHDDAGRPVFSRRVEVQQSRTQQLTIVGR